MTQHIINNLQRLAEFAAQIAASAARIILLEGDLGAGKTEFARAFINSISAEKQNVSSPTYNIVQIYEIGGKKIYHFDLYRLESAEELLEIGFEEALEDANSGGICLIEWPQIAAQMLEKYETTQLKIEILDENSRKISVN